MKVAIFVDGKNFYKGYQQHAIGRRLNFPRLAAWLSQQAGGSLLVGCHYYTGIENNERGASLLGFLAMLETERGYFVHRFPRKTESFQCSNCGEAHVFTREKEVDTTMVADMLRMAAVDAFDAMVLVSGDADHAPAVEGVRSLGKIVFVSTWAGHGLTPRGSCAARQGPAGREGPPPPRQSPFATSVALRRVARNCIFNGKYSVPKLATDARRRNVTSKWRTGRRKPI